MTEAEFEVKFDNGEFDMEYAEYIYENAFVGNGDMLIAAIESGDYYEGFKDLILSSRKAA